MKMCNQTRRPTIFAAVLTLVFTLSLATTVAAQQQAPATNQQGQKGTQGQQGQAQTPPPMAQPAKPSPGQAASQQEFNDFQQVQNQVDPKLKVELGEKFLAAYPESGLKANIYRLTMFAYQQLNDANKCIDYGERYLEIMPQDVEVMSILAFIYAESKKHEEAADRANAANQLIENFTPPATVTPEQWKMAKTSLESMNYSTLGYCHLLRGRTLNSKEAQKMAFDDSVATFKKAIELNPRDDYSYFRMGTVYVFLNKGNEAVDSFAKAVAIGGMAGQAARGELERVYKQTHQDSLDGLDNILKKAAEELQRTTPPGL